MKYTPTNKLLPTPTTTLYQIKPLSAAIDREMPIVVKAIHDKISRNGKNWQEHFAKLVDYITNHTRTAISIIEVIPRHFLFTPTKEGMIFSYAERKYNVEVAKAIRQKLFNGTELEKVIQASKARSRSDSSTALGLVNDDVAPHVDINDSPHSSRSSHSEELYTCSGSTGGCTIQ